MSDDDFNTNLCHRPPSSSLLLPNDGGSGANSNRNSTVSTYRGSECSVRITANPLATSDDNGNVVDDDDDDDDGEIRQDPVDVEISPSGQSAVATTQLEMMEYQGRKISRACGPGSLAWSTMSREEQLRELEEVVAIGGSQADWNYEDFGMTYEELMDYFDNLKESVA